MSIPERQEYGTSQVRETYELKSHQIEALEWLFNHHQNSKGAILADPMGTGKTLTMISLIKRIFSSEKGSSQGGVILVVCPATLVTHWKRELMRYAPEIYTSDKISDSKILESYEGVL